MAVEGAVAAAVAAPSAAAAAAVATAASSAAQLLHRHLSLSPKAKLDQPRPTEARLAPMAVLIVAVVTGAGLSRSLAAMSLAQNVRTHLSSSS